MDKVLKKHYRGEELEKPEENHKSIASTSASAAVTTKKSKLPMAEINKLNYSETDLKIFAPDVFIRVTSHTHDIRKLKEIPCTFEYEKRLFSLIGGKLKLIVSSSREGFIFEVCSREQGERILQVKLLTLKTCIVREHEFFNITKGLVLIYNKEVLVMENFWRGLMEETLQPT